MRRREFIGAVGAAALAVAAAGKAHAERSRKARRVALVLAAQPVSKMTDANGDPFFQGLFSEFRRLGYVEGDNLLIERYSGEGRASQYPALARDVVSRHPDLIIAITNNLVLDFKAATTAIPIVGVFGAPVEAGIVASLARPGGNITGVTVDVGTEQWGKRIQLLQQVVAQATRVGFLQSRAWLEKAEGLERDLDRRHSDHTVRTQVPSVICLPAGTRLGPERGNSGPSNILRVN